METYKKTYAVDNALITYEAWEHHQTQGWKERFGQGAPPSIFDAYGGVADVYYQDAVFLTFRDVGTVENGKYPQFFKKAMERYEAELDAIQAVIAQGTRISDAAALRSFLQKFEDAWIGLDLSYLPYSVDLDASAERRSVAAREKAFGFYVGADRLIRRTLETMFPDLGPLSKYLLLGEVTSGNLPDQSILEDRAKHFIYFKGSVITDISFEEFCKKKGVRIESVYAPLRNHLRGEVASGGKASGPARILRSDAERAVLHDGDVLVARDILPDDLGLLTRVSAVVLDAGSYYGSAAIAARAANKPCVFKTNIATMVLQDGETLMIDGDTGIIHAS